MKRLLREKELRKKCTRMRKRKTKKMHASIRPNKFDIIMCYFTLQTLDLRFLSFEFFLLPFLYISNHNGITAIKVSKLASYRFRYKHFETRLGARNHFRVTITGMNFLTSFTKSIYIIGRFTQSSIYHRKLQINCPTIIIKITSSYLYEY